ncbi:MAG: hypothetical protein WCT04_00770 [Planctomycetota bacterium]
MLPRHADYVVIPVAAGREIAHKNPVPVLGAQYVDDVKLTLKMMPVLPVRVSPKQGSF